MRKIEKIKYPVKFNIKANGRVIENAIRQCGSQAELARKLAASANVKCYAQKINEWRLRGVVPPYWVRPLAEVMNVEPKKIDPVLYD